MSIDQSPAEPTTALSAWRLLHIESDDVDALKLKLTLREELPADSKVDHAASLDEGLEVLHQSAYDAILLGVATSDTPTMDALKHFTAEVDDTPTIVLSGDDDLRAAVTAGRNGASSFLLKSKLTGSQLCGALRQALQVHTYDGQLPERRKEPRYSLETAAVIYPIDADGKPGREIAATTVDISESGIVVLAEQDSDLVPDICLLGVQCPDGQYRYATVEWRHRRLALPAIRFGGRFLRRVDDPLHISRLTPRFDAREMRFTTSLDSAVLQEWVARGILRPTIVDRVQVCPQCQSLPTFRNGCPQCGSALTEQSRLIHHFACAHIAHAAEFGTKSLCCPKCRTEKLVVGADFEYLDGTHSCRECEWTDTELSQIGECLKCGHRFVGEDGVEKEVFEYHVDRLDPLALIDRA
ncbi:MAG: hypothetical protein AAGD11_11755 [Planctomycetota bacterium]